MGQLLTLTCAVYAVRGITSAVDISWITNGTELIRTPDAIPATIGVDHVEVVYRDSYTIPQLSLVDGGQIYQCEVVISTMPPITAIGSVTLHTTGRSLQSSIHH